MRQSWLCQLTLTMVYVLRIAILKQKNFNDSCKFIFIKYLAIFVFIKISNRDANTYIFYCRITDNYFNMYANLTFINLLDKKWYTNNCFINMHTNETMWTMGSDFNIRVFVLLISYINMMGLPIWFKHFKTTLIARICNNLNKQKN